tara:strand:+ start:1506 stop:2021 length:516 start_codon:yes stop_codon:yes gene_type:complete
MIKVKIYGRLRKFIGQSTFKIDANSPKDAFSFLINNFKGVAEHIKDQEYCVMAGNIRITPKLLDLQTTKDIKIIPVIHGEILPFLYAFAKDIIYGYLVTYAISLVRKGIDDLFRKPIEPNLPIDEQDPSFTFTGTTNISKQGVPINIVYGETLIGTNTVSADVDTLQVINT